jgi:hypothetical protein
MFSAGLNGLALVHFAFLNLLENAGRHAMGLLGTLLELVVFCCLVWALLGSRAIPRKTRLDTTAQRLRARQKELTLK